MSYFNLDIHTCYARSNATCRGAMKSHSKKGYTKLRPRKIYSAVNDTTRALVERKRGFAGAAGDKKYIDIANANYPNDTTGSITHWSIVPQNTTVNGRIGKSFRVTSIQMRGFTSFTGLPNVTQRYANYLVWDNSPNTRAATVATAGSGVLDSANALSMISRDQASRFKILRKWYGVIPPFVATMAVSPVTFPIEEFIKLPNDCTVTLTAADATGVIGDVLNGALYFVTVGTNAAGANAMATNVTARVNFQDL